MKASKLAKQLLEHPDEDVYIFEGEYMNFRPITGAAIEDANDNILDENGEVVYTRPDYNFETMQYNSPLRKILVLDY